MASSDISSVRLPVESELRELVADLDAYRTARGLSFYKLALISGVTIDSTRRFFIGHGQGPPGRVHFETAVRIVTALGGRLELDPLWQATEGLRTH